MPLIGVVCPANDKTMSVITIFYQLTEVGFNTEWGA